MRNARRTQVGIAVVGLVGAAWCVALFARHGIKDVFSAVLAAGWGVAAMMGFHFVSMLFDLVSWQVLIPRRNRIGNAKIFLIRWMGDAVNSLLPVAQVGGEIVRVRVATLWGMPFAISAASVLVDMTMCVLTQIIFALSGFWLFVTVSGHSGLDRSLLVAGIIGLACVGGFYAVQRIGIFRIGGAIVSSVVQSPAWRKMASDGRAVDRKIGELYGRRWAVLVCGVCHMATWTAGAVEMWIVMRALGIHGGFGKAYLIECASQTIRSGFFIVPGALGAQEGGFLAMGALLGISGELSMALALIRRVREVVFGLSGIIAWQWVEWSRCRTSRSKAEAMRESEAGGEVSTLMNLSRD